MNQVYAEIEDFIPQLRRYALALSHNPVAADDLIQESVARALMKSDLFNAGTNLRAWLFTIMHNIHISNTRRQKHIGMPIDPDIAAATLSTQPSQEAPLVMKALNKAMQVIPDSQRVAVILAGVEVGLAVMRDQIILADLAFKRDLGGSAGGVVAQAAADLGWMQKVPVAGQMILGFILPFALAFVGLPLENFVHSARTVIGALLVFLLHVFGAALRIASNIFRQLGKALAMLFDALIFLPLSVERLVKSRAAAPAATPAARAQGRAS